MLFSGLPFSFRSNTFPKVNSTLQRITFICFLILICFLKPFQLFTQNNAEISKKLTTLNDTAKLKVLHSSIEKLMLSNKNLEAFKWVDTFKTVSKRVNMPRYFYAVMVLEANIYRQMGWIKESDSIASIAENGYLELIKKDPARRGGLVSIYNCKALNYITIGLFEEAAIYYEKAIEIAKSLKDTVRIISVASNYINLQVKLRKKSHAYLLLKESESLTKQLKDKKILINFINNSARFFHSIGDTIAESQMYQQALSEAKALKLDASIIMNNYANTLPQHKRMAMYRLAIIEAARFNNLYAGALAQGNLANKYKDENENDSAIAIYNRIAILFEKEHYYNEVSETYNNLGRVYKKLNKYEEAIKYFKKSLDIAKIHKLDKMLLSDLRNLAVICEKKGDYKSSVDYWKQFVLKNDSVLNIEKKQELYNVMTKHSLQEQKQKLDTQSLLEKEKLKAKTEAVRKQKNMVLIIGTSVLLLILIFTFFIYRSLQSNKKARSIIARQKELVEEKQAEILDSIHYAKRIQQAQIPSEKMIDKQLKKLRKEN